MKEELIKNITKTMKEIIGKTNDGAIYLTNDTATFKYDIKNDFIFLSLSFENLNNASYTTYCDPTLFKDVSMYDLECLEDYDDNDLQKINNILNSFNK